MEAEGPRGAGEPAEIGIERKGRRGVVWGVVGVVLVAVAVWGYSKWQYASHHESTDDAQVGGHLVPVLAKVGGYVDSVRVRENQPVRAGETLVVLDRAELQQRLTQAQADLAAAEAAAGVGGTGEAEAQVEQARRQQAALTAQAQAARANAEKAHKDLARMQELADKEIVSRQQLDAARAAAVAADASVRALEQQSSGAGAGIANAQAAQKVAAAKVASARSAVDNAKLQLSYARVVAPVSGLASKRNVEPGQLVQPGQPLLTVVADSDVYVTANFKETQLKKVRPGEPAEFGVDAYGCTARGVVESIGGATGSEFALLPPDNATGNYTKVVQRIPVRIRVTKGCGADQPLRPGMSVVAHVQTG
jgi:membrane fusion protein (multidrug efflux system)